MWDTLLDGTVRTLIERELLGPFLQRQPWVQGTGFRSARFMDWGALRRGPEPLFVTIVEAEFEDGVRQGVVLPLAMGLPDHAKGIVERRPAGGAGARVTGVPTRKVLLDAWHDRPICGAAPARRRHGRDDRDEDGACCTPRRCTVYPQLRRATDTLPVSRSASTEPRITRRSTTARPLGLKVFRRVERGVHPEVEVTQHLTQTVGFTRALRRRRRARLSQRAIRPASSVAMFGCRRKRSRARPTAGRYAMEWLGRFFDQAASRATSRRRRCGHAGRRVGASLPESSGTSMGAYVDIAASALGRRTADMHVALAADVRSGILARAARA